MAISKQIYGLIGYPVKHSLSPLMHNAAFKHLGINAEYRLFEIEPGALRNFLFLAKEVEGFNITIPYKIKAKEILEEGSVNLKDAYLAERNLYYVALSGAVNTVKREGGKFKYWNTDAAGFLRSLEEDLNFDAKDKNVLLLGCGGAGRAIIAALSWKDTGVKKIFVYDKNNPARDAAEKHFFLDAPNADFMKEKLEFINQEKIPEALEACQLLVNASNLGMKEGEGSIVDRGLLHKGLSVYDIVYNRQTQLLNDAKSLGLAAAGGLGMLLYQGASAFTLWTGVDAPVEVMRKALNEGVQKI